MLLKGAILPGSVSFAGGLPNPAAFPARELAESARAVLLEPGAKALQYHDAQGFAPLRERIAERQTRKGIALAADEIIITNGSQQGLDVAAGVLLDENDPVLVEKPCYLAALQVFHGYGATVRGIAMDSEGAEPGAFAQALRQGRPKLFYTVPDFQNPTGLSYTEARRKTLAELARSSDLLVLEDNPYGDLCFSQAGGESGAARTSFQSLLGEGCLSLGSFSKIVSPGLRVGWLGCRNALLREALLGYKQRVDVQTGTFAQMVLEHYLRHNDLDAHIATIAALYRERAEWMLDAMERHFPEEVSWTRPEGGMFIWAELPQGLQSTRLAEEAAAAGVMIAAGDPFYEEERGVPGFRLNFTNSDADAIFRGIGILGGIIRRIIKERKP